MITYFVLKGADGKSAGCVRLENGRARASCPCTLLLEDGSTLDLNEEETPLAGPILAAAILQGDAPAAWGTPPGTTLSAAELLYRLRPKPQPAPEPRPQPESTPEPIPKPAPQEEGKSLREPAPEPDETPAPEDSAALADDFGLLVRHAGEVYESILHPPLPEEPKTPAEDPAPDSAPQAPKGDWFSETEQLLSRLRRR